MAAYDVCVASDDDWSDLFSMIGDAVIKDGPSSRYTHYVDDSLKIAINVTEGGGAAGGAYPWVG